MKDFIAIADFEPEQLRHMLDVAKTLKQQLKKTGRNDPVLAGKVLARIFEKPSLRTRVSFSAGMAQLGGAAVALETAKLDLDCLLDLCERDGIESAKALPDPRHRLMDERHENAVSRGQRYRWSNEHGAATTFGARPILDGRQIDALADAGGVGPDAGLRDLAADNRLRLRTEILGSDRSRKKDD